jgi:hypothetical protein
VSRIKLLLRFVLAFVAFTWLLQAFPVALSSPDVHTQLIAAGIAAVIAIPLAAVFVKQSYSLERLGAYLLAVNILAIPIGLVVVGFEVVIQSLVGRMPIFGTPTTGIVVLAAYALSFHLVYRSGYARLKARFA